MSDVIFRKLQDYNHSEHSYPTTIITRPAIDSDDEDDVTHVFRPNLLPTQLPHLYVHFGLEDALLGKSVGMVHRDQYIRILDVLEALDPNLLSQSFLRVVHGKGQRVVEKVCKLHALHDIYDILPRLFIYFCDFHNASQDLTNTNEGLQAGNITPVHFDVDVNIDGVKIFENSTMGSADPILARIHSINGIRVPIMRAKPFVIGVYHGPGLLI